MAELIGPLADVTLSNGMQITVEAVDPGSGSAVTGVKISNLTIFGDTASGADIEDGGSAPLDTSEPVWIPTSLDDLNPDDAAAAAAAEEVASTATGGTAAASP